MEGQDCASAEVTQWCAALGNGVMEFLKSDVGKILLGGALALAGQFLSGLLSWIKDAWVLYSNRRKDAEFLAIRLVLLFDEFVNACHDAVFDPLTEDTDGITESTVSDPLLTLPVEADYKALPRNLMFEILSMPNKLDSIKKGLSAVAEISGPPDFDEFFEYRKEHCSRLGLDALNLIDKISRRYGIAQPQRPDHYTPGKAFLDQISEIQGHQLARQQMAEKWISSMVKQENISNGP